MGYNDGNWGAGEWLAMGAMALIAVVLIMVFWRKRYLAHTRG